MAKLSSPVGIDYLVLFELCIAKKKKNQVLFEIFAARFCGFLFCCFCLTFILASLVMRAFLFMLWYMVLMCFCLAES